MHRRHLLLLLFALAALPPGTSFADQGKGGGGDSGSNSGSGDGGDDNSGSGGGGDDDNSGPGNSEDDDDERGDDNGSTSGKDHDSALRAVETEGTLTLEEFLPQFRRQISGRVVDVSLAKRGDALLFIVTYVDSDGRVRRGRFDARTGKQVE